MSNFIAPYFAVTKQQAKNKLRLLAWLDGLLRISQLSSAILWSLKFSDAGFVENCEYYLAKTSHALSYFEQSLQGIRPNWQPELNHLSAAEMLAWREHCLRDLSMRMATPIHYYATNNH